MKKITLIIILAIIALTSCKQHYSPLNSYVNATIQHATDSALSAQQAKTYIDSLNSAVKSIKPF